MVGCVRKLHNIKFKPRTITCHNYKQYNIASFKSEVSNLSFPDYSKFTNINEAWGNWKTKFLSAVDKHAPLIHKRVRGRETPWITSKIKNSMRERDYFLTKARSSKSELDWSKYRNLRNTVTREIRKAKGRYYRNLLEENLDNPSKFWKPVKKLVPNEKSSTKTSTIRIKHNDKLTEDNYTTANAFCNFFCNLAKQMNNVLIDCSYALNNIIHHARSVNVFNFTPVLPSSILCYLKSIKVCKSSGIDTIPAKLL